MWLVVEVPLTVSGRLGEVARRLLWLIAQGFNLLVVRGIAIKSWVGYAH